jgi:hypothetical protein
MMIEMNLSNINGEVGPEVAVQEIHHHPDGRIWVRTKKGTYWDTRENFNRDWRGGESFPDLPARANERIYRQGIVHCLKDEENVLEGGPLPWPLGDKIIAAVDDLIANQKLRVPAIIADITKQAEQRAIEQAKKLGLPWPPRDLVKEFDALVERVGKLEAQIQSK